MEDIFSSGDQDVEDGFDQWAGIPYSGPRLEIESQLASFNFRPVIYGRCFAYNNLRDWHQGITKMEDYYHSRIRPRIIRAVANKKSEWWLPLYEDEAIEKARVNWRTIGYGRQVFASNFAAHSEAQAQDLRPWLIKKGQRYVKFLESMADHEILSVINGAEIRVDKFKGAPFFQGGANYEAGLALALLGRKMPSKARLDEYLSLASGGVPLYMVMLKRVQASRKQVPRRVVVNGRITASGYMDGCKIRTVKAPPFVHNNQVAWFFDLHKYLMLRFLSEHHSLVPREYATRGSFYAHSFSSDMSTFDDTISEEALTAWREQVEYPILDYLCNKKKFITPSQMKFVLDYDESVVRGKILCPARYTNEVACVLSMEGGVKSGERGTSCKDNDISFARTEALLSILSRNKDDSFLCWGDDLVVLTNDPTLKRRWSACSQQRHLFKEKVAPGAVFLMKSIPSGHGFLMRYATRRYNMETHEEPVHALHAALSLRSTYEALCDPKFCLTPHPAADLYLPMIRECCPAYRGAVDLAENMTYEQLSSLYIASINSVLDARKVSGDDISDMQSKGLDLYDDEVRALESRAAVKARRLEGIGYIKGRYTEQELRDLASLYTAEELIRACKT